MTEQTASALPPVVDRQTWQAALDDLRMREKAATRELDAIAAQRRRLPMVELPDYTLIGPDGPIRLVDVFDGRSQLIVYNHMWSDGAEWQCGGCTGLTSQYVRLGFLDNYDARFVIVTNGPIEEALAYKAKVGNKMDWYSSSESSFGADVGAPPGAGFAVNVFLRDGDKVYRTWHTDGRGTEQLSYTFALIDILPWGRQEEWQDSPDGWPKSPTYSKWLDSPDVARLYGPNGHVTATKASRSGHLPINGLSLYYEVYGELGKSKTAPLLLIPGAFMATDSMKSWVSAFAGTRAVIVFDQQGHGRTPDTSRKMSYEQFADDAAALLQRVEGRARGCDGLLARRRGRAAARAPPPDARQQAGLAVRHLPQGRLVPVGVGGHRGSQRHSVCRYARREGVQGAHAGRHGVRRLPREDEGLEHR